jgi:hypothetical protein
MYPCARLSVRDSVPHPHRARAASAATPARTAEPVRAAAPLVELLFAAVPVPVDEPVGFVAVPVPVPVTLLLPAGALCEPEAVALPEGTAPEPERGVEVVAPVPVTVMVVEPDGVTDMDMLATMVPGETTVSVAVSVVDAMVSVAVDSLQGRVSAARQRGTRRDAQRHGGRRVGVLARDERGGGGDEEGEGGEGAHGWRRGI